ncbi:FAD-dependent monooxygenase [Sphingomonas bacterium]|uniref:FAD-dependent monooxygenase n=1 Tax=Sphingomonas bacterium TaxID=1895847 RepID=UPI001575050D|nr:FAD-dependent monooxygenase [Sphingomonas bacterium]
MHPILIIGAGPVGLTMAAELMRYGVPVRLVDQSPEPSRTSKALVVWSRTLELIDRMGCTGAFLDAGLQAHRAAIRSGASVLGRTGFDDISSPYNFALMIPQCDTERLLHDHLIALGGAVEREVALTGFAQTPSGVLATLRHADGREETVDTPWLIGCDGAHSAVRHGLGLPFDGSAEGGDWILADVRLEGEGKPPADEIAPYLHDDGPFAVFPMPSGRARIVAAVGKVDSAQQRSQPTLDDVQRLIEERAGGGFRATDPVWLANFRINERKVADYRVGRVFLAGDSAHVHSPAGGQGMNTGMQDAFNLAWKLALVVRGEARDILLDSYSEERSKVGDGVLRNAKLMTDMATLSSPIALAARNLALRMMLGLHAVQHRMATTMSEIDIHYASSSLSEGKRAGRRLDPKFYSGAPPGSGPAPRWALFAANVEQATAFASRFGGFLEPAPRAPGDPDCLLIVRPDGYIGFSGDRDDWAEAERYLANIAVTDIVGNASGQP